MYIVADITRTLKEILEEEDFKNTPQGEGMYKYHSKYNAYIEVIPYEKLTNDSKDRNRILFEKLGILDNGMY